MEKEIYPFKDLNKYITNVITEGQYTYYNFDYYGEEFYIKCRKYHTPGKNKYKEAQDRIDRLNNSMLDKMADSFECENKYTVDDKLLNKLICKYKDLKGYLISDNANGFRYYFKYKNFEYEHQLFFDDKLNSNDVKEIEAWIKKVDHNINKSVKKYLKDNKLLDNNAMVKRLNELHQENHAKIQKKLKMQKIELIGFVSFSILVLILFAIDIYLKFN